MTTITQDQDILSLEHIQNRLAEQLAANQEQAAQLQGELVDQNVKLSQCQVHAQQVRGEISQWQTMHRQNELEVKRAQQDLEHAKGSSLEASRMERLTAADSARQKSQHELSILTTQLAKDEQEQGRIEEQVAAITEKLHTLAGQRDELSSANERLSRELCASILENETAAIERVRAEIERLQGQLAEAFGYEDLVLRQGAQRLSPWEKDCLSFVANYIRVEQDPPEVVAVKVQLAQAKEAAATAERTRAQVGADIDPTIASRKIEVGNLIARVEVMQRASRERAAMALLRELRQPAPVPDDLAQAQALHAQSQAMVEVVSQEAPATGPKRERYAPQAGMRTFAALGAVPTPSPSLLNPKVKE